ILGTIALSHLLLSSGVARAQQGLGFDGNGGNRGADPPLFVRLDNFIVVISPRGDEGASFNVQTKKTDRLRLSQPGDRRLQVTPITGPGVVAFHLRGSRITRLAASDTVTGALIPQDLREPFKGEAVPIVGPDVVAYVIGHHAYAFS